MISAVEWIGDALAVLAAFVGLASACPGSGGFRQPG